MTAMEHLDAACYQTSAATAFDHRQAAAAVVNTIQRAVEASGVSVHAVFPFGSTVSGFAVEDDCDVDVCLLCSPHRSDVSLRERLRYRRTLERVQASLKAEVGVVDFVAILGARVPIVKFTLAASGMRRIPVDMCFNALNGVRNTELQRQLAVAEPRFRPLARLIKLWAKRRGLTDASKRFFSSYALVLMVAFFLQSRGLLPRADAFRMLSEGVAAFTPPDEAAWIDQAPSAATDAPKPRRAPPAAPVEAAVRQVVSEEPSIGAKKLYSKVMDLLEPGAAVAPKDVRALLATIKQESSLTPPPPPDPSPGPGPEPSPWL